MDSDSSIQDWEGYEEAADRLLVEEKRVRMPNRGFLNSLQTK